MCHRVIGIGTGTTVFPCSFRTHAGYPFYMIHAISRHVEQEQCITALTVFCFVLCCLLFVSCIPIIPCASARTTNSVTCGSDVGPSLAWLGRTCWVWSRRAPSLYCKVIARKGFSVIQSPTMAGQSSSTGRGEFCSPVPSTTPGACRKWVLPADVNGGSLLRWKMI